MAVVGFRVGTGAASGVDGTMPTSVRFRVEGRAEVKLLEVVSDVLPLALTGSRGSFVGRPGWCSPLEMDAGSELEVEVVPWASPAAFAAYPTGSSVLSEPCAGAVGYGVGWPRATVSAVECTDVKDSLFASEMTSGCVATPDVTGDGPAEKCVAFCMPGVDLLVTSVLAAGMGALSEVAEAAVAGGGAGTWRLVCLWKVPGSSGTAAAGEVAARGSGDAARAFSWSSFHMIFFTHSSCGFAQISLSFLVVNLK